MTYFLLAIIIYNIVFSNNNMITLLYTLCKCCFITFFLQMFCAFITIISFFIYFSLSSNTLYFTLCYFYSVFFLLINNPQKWLYPYNYNIVNRIKTFFFPYILYSTSNILFYIIKWSTLKSHNHGTCLMDDLSRVYKPWLQTRSSMRWLSLHFNPYCFWLVTCLSKRRLY